MDQTNVENGNVETLLYKNRIARTTEAWKSQEKFNTSGKILGKGNYEFYKDENGRLVQIVPANLRKCVKRVISSLEQDGLVAVSNDHVLEETTFAQVEEAIL